MQWNYKKHDTIRFNHSIGNIYRTGGYGGTYGKATFAVWVYCEKPQKGALKFEFRTGNKVSGSFDFPLNFTGWQRAALRYSWKSMFDGKVSPTTDNILITAPEKSGRCFIDLMCYNIIKDFRTQFRPSGKKWGPPVIDKKQYPLPCEITDSDKEAIVKIRNVFAPEGKNQITEKSIQSLKGSIEKLNIIKEKGRISGIPVIFPVDGYEAEGITDFVSPKKISNIMLRIATTYNKKGTQKDKKQLLDWYILLNDHLVDQGFRPGSGNIWNWYNGRSLAQATFIMANALRQAGKAKKPFNYYESNYKPAQIYHPEKINPSMDFFHIDMKYLLYGALMQTDEEKIIRGLKAFQQYLNKAILFEGHNGYKPDGSAFHHNFHYFAYASYATNSLSMIVEALSDTPFAISPEAWLRLKKVLLNMRFYSNKTAIPLTMQGRHPFGKQDIYPECMARIARCAPGGKVDEELAAAANRVKPGVVPGIKPENPPQGHLTMNFAGLGAHRRDKWLALVRGYGKYIRHGETYAKNNRFGKFLAHGSLMIQKNGLKQSGYVQNGFDWAAIDGTTCPHQPVSRLRARGGTVSLTSPVSFVGGLEHRGVNGMFVMPISGPRQQGVPKLKGLKSFFFFDREIICLGSQISNQDKNDVTRTNLFQKYLKTKDMPMWINGSKITEFPFKDTKFNSRTAIKIVDPYNVGYYIFPGQKVYYARKHQISRHQKDTKDTEGDFASCWIDYGLNPQNEKYRYAVIPQITPEAMAEYEPDFQIIRQDALVHAVKYKQLYGAIFFAGMKNISAPLVKAVERPCLTMSEKNSKGYYLTVCDPDLGMRKTGKFGYESQPAKIRIAVKGSWKLIGKTTKATVIAANAKMTILEIPAHNGQSIGMELEPENREKGDMKNSSGIFDKCLDYNLTNTQNKETQAMTKKAMQNLFGTATASVLLAASGATAANNLVKADMCKTTIHAQDIKKCFDGNVQTDWRGFYGKNSRQDIAIDFGKTTTFNTVTIAAAYLQKGTVMTSNDGQKWQKIGTLKPFGKDFAGLHLIKPQDTKMIKIDLHAAPNKKKLSGYVPRNHDNECYSGKQGSSG